MDSDVLHGLDSIDCIVVWHLRFNRFVAVTEFHKKGLDGAAISVFLCLVTH